MAGIQSTAPNVLVSFSKSNKMEENQIERDATMADDGSGIQTAADSATEMRSKRKRKAEFSNMQPRRSKRARKPKLIENYIYLN